LVVVLQTGRVLILDQSLALVGPEFRVLESEDSTILSIAFDPSGKVCAVVNMKGISFLPSFGAGHRLTCASPLTGTIAVHEVKPNAAWPLVKKWKGHEKYILKAVYSPDGKCDTVKRSSFRNIVELNICRMFATSSSDSTIKIWRVDLDYKMEKVLSGHQVRPI